MSRKEHIMTLGEKIKKYRLMKNLTQKDLGIKVGFSAATADSRIRKYEKDIMAPKNDIRQKIADALDIDLSALSDINIESYEDIMQILFLFEENLGMEIERKDGKTHLIFDDNNKDIEKFISYLYIWHSQKKNLISTSDTISTEEMYKYKIWKSRFPKDINAYWNKQLDDLDQLYAPLVKKSASKNKKITLLSEFLLQIRKLIQSGVSIETNVKLSGTGQAALVLGFYLPEILNTNNKERLLHFADYIYNLETLQSYGMLIDRQILTKEKGTQVIYSLQLSPLSAFKSTIDKISHFENDIANKNDWDIESFESQFESDLKMYDMNLKEEIEHFYS